MTHTIATKTTVSQSAVTQTIGTQTVVSQSAVTQTLGTQTVSQSAVTQTLGTQTVVTQTVGAQPTDTPDNGLTLRIMPLGASITYGWLSTDGNGYREHLLTRLLDEGLSSTTATAVSYVGSRHHGIMTQNEVEGWPGLRIDQILPKARTSVPRYLPNVILLNAGTNDCVQDFDVDSTTRASHAEPQLTSDASDNVGSRLRAVVGGLLGWSPNVTVVVSTLVNNMNAATQARVDDANGQFRDVTRDMQAAGMRVVLADMSAAAGGPNRTTMTDVTHPNDDGYALMANRWYAALVEANEKGFIVQPV